MYLNDYPLEPHHWICRQCYTICAHKEGVLKELQLCTLCEHANRVRYTFASTDEEIDK